MFAIQQGHSPEDLAACCYASHREPAFVQFSVHCPAAGLMEAFFICPLWLPVGYFVSKHYAFPSAKYVSHQLNFFFSLHGWNSFLRLNLTSLHYFQGTFNQQGIIFPSHIIGPQGLVDLVLQFFLPWPALSMKHTGVPNGSWMFRLVAFISCLVLYVLSPETLVLKKACFWHCVKWRPWQQQARHVCHNQLLLLIPIYGHLGGFLFIRQKAHCLEAPPATLSTKSCIHTQDPLPEQFKSSACVSAWLCV